MRNVVERWITVFVLLIFLSLLFTVVRTSVFGSVDKEKHIYFEIVFLLLLAVVGELAVAYLKLPSVMILMILGIIIGPSFMGLIWEYLHFLPLDLPEEAPEILRLEEVIHVFAQLGAVILLFKVGLHSKISSMFSKANLLVAVLGVVLPFVVGFGYASLTGGNFAYSMFLGAALTATSVGVTVALLKEMKMVEERFAQVIVGAAIIDDVLSLLVLSFVINLASGDGSLWPLAGTLLSAVVFLSGGILAGDYFIRYLDRKPMSPRRFIIAVAFMLFYAYFAEFIKLSAIVGAFIAGVIINRSRHIAEIEEKSYSLEVLFMPIFFISLGILVDVRALAEFAIPIIIITVLALLSKLIPCYAGSRLSGLPGRDALAIGVGMIPRGEVALIVASIGLTSGVLNISEYSIISAMALLTTLAVPPILSRILRN